MQLNINDYNEPDHFRQICEDNYNVSRTGEYEKNEMHHIHNTCEILFIEDGIADYFISGKKYQVEPGDILVIGTMEHHLRRIEKLPFLRHGLTLKPTYYRSIILDHDLLRVFGTPTPEDFHLRYKNVDKEVFQLLVDMICYLKTEEGFHKPFRSQIERTIVTQLTVILFRLFSFKKSKHVIPESSARMLEIKEYIDIHYNEELNLNSLSKRFFLHPSTISKDFSKYCGYNLNKYINTVRVCAAANLLENNGYSISTIGDKCGFNGINTFLRQFKSIMEISPLQYRKSVHDLWETNQRNKNMTADI